MKKLIVAIVLGFLSTQVYALSGTTKGGHAACLKKQWLDDVVSFVVAKDMDSFQAYLDSKKCIVLKKGLRVTVTESPGMFGGTAGFVFKGIKFWTVREALEYGN
ncbi:hypothetical protein [Candidatus Venteria ishoeyi]|uniref:Uncharacterized protein n=1 Tax=Candidatus Venteria ishoeyi TaxID=1899563 RepID=A0A1H6FDF8_9GAMM|nr:hypothetical protein [Candidatus Venteria ishoeyi]SEH08108.1 Uncharacterised protein [Candidatus Venteria ishoeyi]